MHAHMSIGKEAKMPGTSFPKDRPIRRSGEMRTAKGYFQQRFPLVRLRNQGKNPRRYQKGFLE